jgi:hypothetical protein
MSNYSISAENLKHFINNEGKKLNGAPFTIRSKKSGKDYTFKVSQVPFKDNNYIHIKVETEYLNFKYMGWYRDGKIINKKLEVNTPASQAVSWFLRQMFSNNFDNLNQSLDIFHLGKCLKCGKTLTDSNSIEVGFGPVCRNF